MKFKLVASDSEAYGRCRVENFEYSFGRRVELHDGGLIATAVAVVRRRPYSDQQIAERVLVALIYKLMRTRDQTQSVHLIELQRERSASAQ
jgi:hypothetical protein